MNNINQTIKDFLTKNDLVNDKITYLVAFSGGYDSMCLLHSLKKITKNKIVAIHLNHNWRGEESDSEENNCFEFCKKIGVEFYSEKLSSDIAHTETVAREARYEFFERCSKKFSSDVIFTAHNKNDNAETLIYRLCMGTGIVGLQGISPVREKYYRPLLAITRAEIEDYCHKNSLVPNNDSSNFNSKYKRNNIRLNILPKLQEINANVVDTLFSLSEVATEEVSIVEEYLVQVLSKITVENKILTSKFLKLSDALQRKIVYKLFIDNNLDYDRTRILNILEFIKTNSTSKAGEKCSLTTGLWLFVSQKYIEVIDNSKEDLPEFHILKTGEYRANGYVFEILPFDKQVKKFPPDSDNIAYVDLAKLEFDFDLRRRENGDIIEPLGLKGTQKLKKYLNAKQIPNHQKDNLMCLAQNNEILWVVGFGISDKIKVKTRPTHRLRFYKEGDNNGN